MKKKKLFKNFTLILVCFGLLMSLLLFSVNAYVMGYADDNIISAENAEELKDVDCIIVLGCQVKPDKSPSHMLRDRLTRGVELYKNGVSPKILMSGDHGGVYYDEVNTMKSFAIENGVPSSDVFMDHAGFSTYETIYRAKEIFKAKKVVIVTQKYHLYRAVYIAEKLGLEAYGVDSDYNTYYGQTKREIREILARCKDFVTTITKPKPTYLGKEIPISNGDGDITNDKQFLPENKK